MNDMFAEFSSPSSSCCHHFQTAMIDHLEQKLKRQFIKEALALSKLEHPFINKLEAVFIDGANGYLQLALHRGGSLAEYLKALSTKNKQPLSLRVIYSLFSKMAQTIAYVHGCGLIHCDINVGCGRDDVMILCVAVVVIVCRSIVHHHHFNDNSSMISNICFISFFLLLVCICAFLLSCLLFLIAMHRCIFAPGSRTTLC